MKELTEEFKKSTKFGKLYLLPKISGRPVISNCGCPMEKCSKFLDHNLKLSCENASHILKALVIS